jgi:hypothetical protein
MSLFISSVFTYDEDAGNYIQAVEGPSGDNQALEPATRKAINNFVIGCKQDGIWDAIKASCILAGARTRLGALTPLVGTAPDSFNFVDANYNRKTGLVGDGSTKSLSTNTNAVNFPTLSLAAWLSTSASADGCYIGTFNAAANVSSQCIKLGGQHMTFTRATNGNSSPNRIAGAVSSVTGFVGASLAGVTQTHRSGGSNIVASVTVQSDPNAIFGVLGRQTDANTFGFYSNARLAFYSIGESLDLARLDARVTDLINAFAVTIP